MQKVSIKNRSKKIIHTFLTGVAALINATPYH
jgi:hypothetical protein